MAVSKVLVFLAFYSVFGAVLIVFTLKGALLMGRYGITGIGTTCEESSTDSNQTSAVTSQVSHEYIFTVIVYGIASILRFVEYFLLAKQFHYFLFKQKEVEAYQFFTKHSHRFYYLLLFSVILLPYFLLGFIIPSLGIYQELELSDRLAECYRHYHEVYIVYCVINMLRYMSAYSVRLMMMFTTLALSKYWFPDHAGAPRHTSVAHFKYNRNRAVSVGHMDNTHSHLTVDNSELRKVLLDWNVVSEDYQKHAQDYAAIGKHVQEIQELFQTWFIVPWVVYLLASSLKTYNILRPWHSDGDGDTPPSNIPHIYYLLYNINQFITLLIPYLCAKKMNTYHQKYYKLMRDNQLKVFEKEPSKLSFARQLVIEKEECYDFMPRIIGTSITINIGSPLFVVLLLAGLFLSVMESLL